MQLNRKLCCSRRALAIAFTLAAKTLSVGQTFNVSPLPSNTAPTATLTPTAGQYFRISNLNGVVGTTPNAAADLSSTAATSLGGADTDNYLSRIGQFTFANDVPIMDVTLSLRVHSVTAVNGDTGNLVSGENAFDRSPFLMHDFGLLFVGSAGTEFVLTRSSVNSTSPFSADENFSITSPLSGDHYLQYIDQPNYDVNNQLIPQSGQIRSLEWLSSDLNDPDSSLAWQPDAVTPLDRTFPVTADLGTGVTVDTPNGVTDIGFYATRGINSGAPFLYSPGAGPGNLTWNIYLFSTGLGVPSNVQLNLSEITVTLSVPEASHAIAGGTALILVAGLLRPRQQPRR